VDDFVLLFVEVEVVPVVPVALVPVIVPLPVVSVDIAPPLPVVPVVSIVLDIVLPVPVVSVDIVPVVPVIEVSVDIVVELYVDELSVATAPVSVVLLLFVSLLQA
jgi:hypothetical protein